MKYLRDTYKEYGIYIFPCNKCDDGIQALHLQKCQKPGCENTNLFF